MLTKEQLHYFRGLLEAERMQIQASIEAWRRDISDPGYDDTAGVDDIGDESMRIFQKESELENIERAQRKMRQVEHALARMDAQLYGVSEVSGRPIPLERLEALPWATTLVGENAPDAPPQA